MKRRIIGMIAVALIVICLCACETDNKTTSDNGISFPSIYINTMEEDFDIYYMTGRDFDKTPAAVKLANETESKSVQIYSCEESFSETSIDNQMLSAINCGIGFDTEDGTPETDVKYSRCTIVWNDGTEDTFNCDITFAADMNCDNWINYSEEAGPTECRIVFDNPTEGEYVLTEESTQILNEISGNYSLANDGEKTVLEMDHPSYDIVKVDLVMVNDSKACVLQVNRNM